MGRFKMGLVLKDSWLILGTSWVEKDTMKPLFTKVCPHCSGSINFKIFDNWKKHVECEHCHQAVEFHNSRRKLFLIAFGGFWLLMGMALVLPMEATTVILLTIILIVDIPSSTLVPKDEVKSKFKKIYPVIQMIVLGTVVNSMIILGMAFYRINSQ